MLTSVFVLLLRRGTAVKYVLSCPLTSCFVLSCPLTSCFVLLPYVLQCSLMLPPLVCSCVLLPYMLFCPLTSSCVLLPYVLIPALVSCLLCLFSTHREPKNKPLFLSFPILPFVWSGGCWRTRTPCPSTSVTTLWVI